MYQPEPTAYIQVPTGYGIAHGLPQYTFEETPFGLSGRGGGGGYGGGPGAAGVSGGGAGTLLFTSPIFSASSSAVGPASGSFQFHHPNTATAPAPSSILHQPSPASHASSSIKMEPNHDEMGAQEAAARDYQPNHEVDASPPPFFLLPP